MANEQFEQAAKRASAGETVEVTPREFLGWWDAARRGRNIVARIRKQLKRKKLSTVPDFESVYIDGTMLLVSVDAMKAKKRSKKSEPSADVPEADGSTLLHAAEPAHRISRLQAANRSPVTVKPSDTIERAVTLMLQNDYSQLPVMATPSKVVGMVSWRSICRKLHVAGKCNTVEECLDRAYELPQTASLFEAIQLVAAHDAVLVRAENNLICGIVTGADTSLQFGTLAEPFLLLGDIENVLRCVIERSFNVAELAAAVDPADGQRAVTSVNDLTFGEYLRFVEKPENWAKLGLKLDRSEIVKKLEQIREIRNDVMHFDPDPLASTALDLLRSFARFLGELPNLLE